MKTLGSKIEAVMQADNGGPFRLLSGFLLFLSGIYGSVSCIRSIFYDNGIARVKKLPCRVISIGNLTAGGTGKTPMTIYMAEMLKQSGFRPAIISRGYKGSAEHSGGVVGDGRRVLMDAVQAGDEPYMMACRLPDIPLLVGKNRYEMGKRAIAGFHPDVIILDDGFQHRRLFRDLDLVLIDNRRYLGNRRLIPRGMLREPISALERADAFILTRCGQAGRLNTHERLGAEIPGKPIFETAHVPYGHALVRHGRREPLALTQLKTRKAFLFSGIAQNDEFARMIADLAGAVCGTMKFGDHHPYTPDDLDRIFRQAKESGAGVLITTEKDYARLPENPHLGLDLAVIGVRIEFIRKEAEFNDFVRGKLGRSVR